MKTISALNFCESIFDGTHDSPKYIKEGKKLITSKYLGRHVDFINAPSISDEDYNSINKRSKVKQYDVLFSMIGTVGQTYLIKECPDFAIKNIGVFRAKNECDARYLHYYFQSQSFQEIIRLNLTGSTQKFLGLNQLKRLPISVCDEQLKRHIVDTIGSVDSLIELNQEKISKIKRLATQKYEFLYKTYPKSAIGKRLKFIKGKQPKFASKEDGEPYLIIDDLASNIHTQFSSEGLVCDENDVLMVMDGASSGKVFTGNKGYVGSTLAKLSSPQIKPSILYFGLSKFEEEIMKNTTGSAIPHTDKSFVSELRIVDDLDDKTTDFFNFCLNQICNLRTQNSLLYIQKEILLKKYFH